MSPRRILLLVCAAFVCTSCALHPPVSITRPAYRYRPITPVGAMLVKALESPHDQPKAVLGRYLDAAATAADQLQSHPRDAAARRDYNFALGRVFTTLRDAKIAAWGKEPLRLPGAEGEWLLSGRTDITRAPILPLFDFIPADQIELNGTYGEQRSVKEGLGAPLVAISKPGIDATKSDPFTQGKQVYYSVTALLRFEGRRCVVSFLDPLKTENVQFAGHTYPLAADFTASIALVLAREHPEKLGLARFFRPEKYTETARLARLQPYDPAKIPVIFVHGLVSSPATWAPMINALRADPAIRARYQFWFYSYPSGEPYPYSAMIMRQRLDAINARYPGHKKVVLIGHSMGGCISRLMITDTGDKLWMKVFKEPPEKTPFSPESKKLLTSTLIFRHRPEVGSVIFISTPHRGAYLAGNLVGRIASSLVKSPAKLLNVGNEALKITTFESGELKLKRIPNSVDTLAPNNRFVEAINTIPITPGIPYYTICGDRGKGGNKDHTKPVMTDGVVPYWSAHLDGAQSELIVPSDHGANANPQAIAEVKRILKHYAGR